jgi:hypothetical protein
VERNFRLLPGIVQVRLEDGKAPAEIVPVLSEAARFARAKRRDLLVVSGRHDPATAEAVCMALEEMHALGSPSKIAFVACLLHQYTVYHFAEHYAQKLGIAVKVMVSVSDARDWLARGERVSPPPD